MMQITEPVLTMLAKRQLKARMPVEGLADRRHYTHLEAFGRTLAGIAPWLELTSTGAVGGEEGALCERWAQLARQALDAATDPTSADFLNFTDGLQPIVDAAFLAQGILRAPRALWHQLDDGTKGNVVGALKATRDGRKPHFSNWLMFSATIEAALHVMGESWDHMRVDYALRQHEQWYAGDGFYSDGPEFKFDYYNSFVIQPMLVDVMRAVGHAHPEWERHHDTVMVRARRYAHHLERLIAADGSFAPVGRSLTYRFGAFQLLAQLALLDALPESLPPAQVRTALTAVIERTLQAPDTFDEAGWLRIGLFGSQPHLAESYISTGSLYLCSTVFLPLGLSPSHRFWQDGPLPWTSKRLWS